MRAKFNNTINYAKFIFKREIFSSVIWLFIILSLTVVVAFAFSNMFGGSRDDMIGMAETMKNPAMVAMVGPVYGIDNECIQECHNIFPDEIYQICPGDELAVALGLELDICINPQFLECRIPCYDEYNDSVMYAQMMLVFIVITVAIMNIFLVVNHTRKDEENGRIELIRSLPVGRLSNLKATMIIALIVNLTLTVIITFGLYLTGMDGMSLSGSFLYGSSLGVSGLLFASIAALFAQVASTSRGALSYSFITLGVLYLLRGVGDVSLELLSYISPLGLILRTEIFYTDNWYPIWIVLGLAIIIAIIAFYLNHKRDLGAGLIPAKPGKKEAGNLLKSPMGLTLTILKATIIGWAITIFIAGASYGSIYGDIETFIGDNEMLQQVFLNNMDFTFAEQMTVTLMVISAVLVTIPVLICLLRLRTEENKGRLEQIYAKPVAKKKMLINHIIVAIACSIDFVLLFGFGLWIAAATVMAEPISLGTVLISGIVYLPAIWVMIGLGTLLIAYLPRWSGLIWGFLGFSFFIVYIGNMLNLPEWLNYLIPFSLIPMVPVEPINWFPLIILTIIALLMMIIGVNKYNKRDLLNN